MDRRLTTTEGLGIWARADALAEFIYQVIQLSRVPRCGDYCSQKVVDNAIGFLEALSPDLIQKLMLVEHWRRQPYSKAAWAVLEYLAEQHVDIPATLLGRMDLIAELTRPEPP